jgi:hypothetical protein
MQAVRRITAAQAEAAHTDIDTLLSGKKPALQEADTEESEEVGAFP